MSLSVFASPVTLTRYLTETPDSVEKALTRKEQLYSVAMKISAVAAVVFFALPLFATGVTFVSISAAIICAKLYLDFDNLMLATQQQKSFYATIVANASKKIKPGETEGIDQFFKEHGGSVEKIPLTTQAALAKINPANPLDALKPLIIRYREADLLPYGLGYTVAQGFLAKYMLQKADTKHNREAVEKQVKKETAIFGLIPHYAKQKAECAEFLGLKA